MSRKKGNDDLDFYAEEKKKYLDSRLDDALEAGCKLCKCGGLIFIIDGVEYCGDCRNPIEYKP